jgi:ribose 5-phosphate isomerase B
VDYPDIIHPLAKEISENNDSKGIIMCGTGNGVSMVANKYEGVRAGLCWSKEIAELIRKHNNANILSLPARFISIKDALEIVKVFLETDFEEGGRHERRVNKIDK